MQGSVLSFVGQKEISLMEEVEDHLKIGYGADETIMKYKNLFFLNNMSFVLT